ncbi:hypothetical protein [Taklimakanibacter albus]|uniref:Uncharacterized protein n=1 Tax=Taklimakanibacter albus TaxID=2800327 RepID=A0ACC5RGH5_9HYPH|nr:hypothetical protein [Aestuariivirga sp. YIM B02566]MBK1871570.1 hypothetical protein [Aestuariivirga sp. YIM B02566]
MPDLPSYSAMMTEMEAVNLILRSCGIAPLTTNMALDETPDGAKAHGELMDTARNVLSSGWNFNRNINVKLAPNVDGHVLLPANTLKVDTICTDYGKPLIQRGAKLYDREANSFVIGKEIIVEIYVMLAWEEIPQVARNYIAVVAARRATGGKIITSGEAWQFTREDELKALTLLEQHDSDIEDFDSYNVNPHFAKMGRR